MDTFCSPEFGLGRTRSISTTIYLRTIGELCIIWVAHSTRRICTASKDYFFSSANLNQELPDRLNLRSRYRRMLSPCLSAMVSKWYDYAKRGLVQLQPPHLDPAF